MIHGTALSREQLGDLKDAGAKLVWSPQSNLRLYGETTSAADALELGLPVGLGADWLPSGSTSLLAELKVARRCLAEQGREPTAKQLVADGHEPGRGRSRASTTSSARSQPVARPTSRCSSAGTKTRGENVVEADPIVGRAGDDRRRPGLRPRRLARR